MIECVDTFHSGKTLELYNHSSQQHSPRKCFRAPINGNLNEERLLGKLAPFRKDEQSHCITLGRPSHGHTASWVARHSCKLGPATPHGTTPHDDNGSLKACRFHDCASATSASRISKMSNDACFGKDSRSVMVASGRCSRSILLQPPHG